MLICAAEKSLGGISDFGTSASNTSERMKNTVPPTRVARRCCRLQRSESRYAVIIGPSAERISSCGFKVYAATSGVIRRATNNEKNTAAATVKPNCLKYWPVNPPMKLTGRNTAMIVADVATTASPISSAASSAA